jgi:hypothetical protein
MSATTFDQHVDEALALIAPARRPAAATRPGRSSGALQHSWPRLTIVRTVSHEGSEQ